MSEAIALPIEAEPVKKCRSCDEVKPLDAFHRRGRNGRDRRADCADCLNDRKRGTRSAETARRNKSPEAIRRWNLKAKYGITPEQYDAMLSAQGGGCAICGEEPPEDGVLPVDHCHKTGRVRALLCNACNMRVGVIEAFRDRVELFLATYGGGNPLLYDDLG